MPQVGEAVAFPEAWKVDCVDVKVSGKFREEESPRALALCPSMDQDERGIARVAQLEAGDTARGLPLDIHERGLDAVQRKKLQALSFGFDMPRDYLFIR